jgi:ribonucleoside-triphosphate reductase
MRSLEAIDADLNEVREELAGVKGKPAEVYSRIVGYYRSVRNWNKGKREEYGERKMFDPEKKTTLTTCRPKKVQKKAVEDNPADIARTTLMLFVKARCPNCPPAKDAAGKLTGSLGIALDTVDAGTEAGIAKASEYGVFSTPTAILFSENGDELGRAGDAASITGLGRLLGSPKHKAVQREEMVAKTTAVAVAAR